MLLQSDTFSIGEGEKFVVVHDRVHVLHPQCVHIAVKQDVPPFVLVCRFVQISEDVGEEPVCPVAGDGVQDTIQLNHGASLGVQGVQLCGQAKSNQQSHKR